MKITNGAHKNLIIYSLFQNGSAKPAPQEMVDGKHTFNNEEIELTPGETVAAKYFYDNTKLWPWNISEELEKELKELFYPPQNVTKS